MRIHRITIRRYRGVEECTVTLPDAGVAVIEGPNEVGKSSLVEALDLLLEYQHDSRHRHLLAVQPVDRDVATEVEAELTTGPYRVVYAKRWFRQPATHLQVRSPQAESLTGRRAHDRMVQILGDTLDRDLYAALRWVQGAGSRQGSVGASTSLVRALDAAAGGSADPEAESTLWEAAESEYLRYYTPTGRRSQERDRAAADLADAEGRCATARQALQELQALGDEYRSVQADLAAATADEAAAERELAAAAQAADAVDAANHNLLARQAEQEKAERREDAARAAAAARRAQVDDVARSVADLGPAAAREDTAGPAHADAADAVDRVTAAHGAADAERVAARAGAELADRDREFRRAEVHLGQVATRRQRVAGARTREEAARRVIDGSLVTADVRVAVEAAAAAVTASRAALRAASPAVEVEALADLECAVDGVATPLAAGQRRQVPVEGTVVVAVGQARVTVRSGTSADDLATEVAAAEGHLAGLVQRYGLDRADPQGSLARALDARREAEHQLQLAADVRADALAGLTDEALAAQAGRLAEQVGTYLAERAADPPLPADAESAEAAWCRATARLRSAETSERQRRSELDACLDRLSRCRSELETARELHRQLQDRHGCAVADLDAARAARADDALADELVAAEEDADKARAATATAQADLRALDPDGTRCRLDAARQCRARAGRDRQGLEAHATELRSALRARGQADLQADLDAAEAHVEQLGVRTLDLERRAAAARCLRDTLARHRDAARQAYVAPYRQHVERLARLVFGTDTAVDVDPSDFSIVSCTRAGVTVPFDALSSGAREQLGVVARLACAVLVGAGGASDDRAVDDRGVPVILDDALGCSDPERLRRMAPAFAAAAGAQVIVLTSQPDRYARVEDATVIRLGRPGTAP